MIDRQVRDELIADIRGYVSKKGFVVSNPLLAMKYMRSSDSAVSAIAEGFDEFYEDAAMRGDVSEKEVWDCWQRLLVVLSCDAELEERSFHFWHFNQIVATVLICVLIAAMSFGGVGWLFFMWGPVWGAAETSNYFMRIKYRRLIGDRVNFNCYPFVSREQIRGAYLESGGFRKEGFERFSEKKVGVCRLVFGFFLFLYQLAGRGVYLPIGLIFQLLPMNVAWYEVVE